MKRRRWTALVVASVAVPAAAPASDTVDYTYDALARLTDISTTGGPNAGATTATRYDPAGNRTSHSVAGIAAAALASSTSSSSIDGADTSDLAAEGAASEAPADADELVPAEEVPAAPVDAPAGIPDESEPVVEVPGAGR
jgi:hypothetical protein